MKAQYKHGQHIMMRVEDIRVIPNLNPPDRTNRLKDLRQSIEQHGILDDLKVNQDGILVDGHRRLSCAKELGLPTVPCKVVEGNPFELWAIFNGPSMKVSGKHWTWITSQKATEGVLSAMSPAFRRYYRNIMDVAGAEFLRRCAEEGVSLSIWNRATQFAKRCGRGADKAFLAKMLWWLLRFKAQRQARIMLESGMPPAILESAVEEGHPLWSQWDEGVK